MDVEHAEMVEAQLDHLITRRHDKRETDEGHRPSEEMYEESCRVYAEQERELNRAAWSEHYARMRAVHWSLADEYDEKLKRLEETA